MRRVSTVEPMAEKSVPTAQSGPKPLRTKQQPLASFGFQKKTVTVDEKAELNKTAMENVSKRLDARNEVNKRKAAKSAKRKVGRPRKERKVRFALAL